MAASVAAAAATGTTDSMKYDASTADDLRSHYHSCPPFALAYMFRGSRGHKGVAGTGAELLPGMVSCVTQFCDMTRDSDAPVSLAPPPAATEPALVSCHASNTHAGPK